MRSLAVEHPEDGALLLYLDGELAARKRRQLERHIQACWQCRTAVKDLESTVAACVNYRQTVLQGYLPEPPGSWADLYPQFARIDAEREVSNRVLFKYRFLFKYWGHRLAALFGSFGVRKWVLAGAVASLMVSAVWYETPSVQAAVLLKRAVMAADAESAKPRKVRVRTHTLDFTRTITRRRAASENTSAALLQARFDSARFNWDDPLSARSYQAWREGAAHKTDEVASVADAQSPSYRIRTVAAEGDLASASLVLRSADLRPIEERLEFRDSEWVELTDITDATTGDDGNSVAAHVGLPVRPAVPSRPAATSGPASISDELQVLAALQEIGADLGDPVEVTLSGGQVLVGGVGITSARQKQIQARLDGLTRVTVDFSEPLAAHPAPAEPETSAPPSGGADFTGLQTLIRQQAGGQAEFEKFSSQLLDRDESLMARAYALRRLAVLFPEDNGITAGDREVLRVMARRHAEALAREVADLDRILHPLLISLGGSAALHPFDPGPSWQATASGVARSAHRLEVLVSVLLGATPPDTAPEKLPSDLLETLNQVRAGSGACLRQLAQ